MVSEPTIDDLRRAVVKWGGNDWRRNPGAATREACDIAARLRRENRVLREALQRYADEDQWCKLHDGPWTRLFLSYGHGWQWAHDALQQLESEAGDETR